MAIVYKPVYCYKEKVGKFMEMITKIIIGAVVVEAIIEYFSSTLSKDFKPKYLLSVSFGSTFAILYGLDLLAILGLETPVPYVGMILTGILLSRGSNYISDFIKKLGDKHD